MMRMNTMTKFDMIKDAKSRSAFIVADRAMSMEDMPLIIIRQSVMPTGLGTRGVIQCKDKIYRVGAIQHKKFSDIDDSEIKLSTDGPFREWVSFFESMNNQYEHFSASEIMALVWTGEEILL